MYNAQGTGLRIFRNFTLTINIFLFLILVAFLAPHAFAGCHPVNRFGNQWPSYRQGQIGRSHSVQCCQMRYQGGLKSGDKSSQVSFAFGIDRVFYSNKSVPDSPVRLCVDFPSPRVLGG